MLGIPSYEPYFFDDVELFRRTFQETLQNLIGKSITRFWVMWDKKENEWYPDGPVILEIDDNRYEFTAYQLDEFSLTINTINLDEKLDWYGMAEELPLSWKVNGNDELLKNLDQPIKEVRILTYNFISEYIEDKHKPQNVGRKHETGYMLHGIEFDLKRKNLFDTENYFTIFNALDKNGLTNIDVQHNDQIRRIRITGYDNV